MLILTWSDIDGLVSRLGRRLTVHSFDAIVGISRSGLIPAVMLSHALGVRDFAVLDIIRTRSDDIDADKHEPRMRGALNLDTLRGRRVLLVDDIVGAGATMLAAREQLVGLCSTLTSVTLVVNADNLGARQPADVVDHFAALVHGWVIFPWEGKHDPGEDDARWSEPWI